MKKQIKRQPKKQLTPKECSFCKGGTVPVFSDTKTLEKFVSERGKILSRSKTGVCAKHQRALTLSVKHARHVALMPFVARV
jgi:small subunit ribosomal protein S18